MILPPDPPPLGGVITLTKHDTTGSASDRQAGALSQFEITPAMVDAGVDAWFDSVSLYVTDEPSYDDMHLVVRHILEAACKHLKHRN